MVFTAFRILLLFCLFLAPFPADADERFEAKQHFQAGITLLKAEDFKAAAAELELSVKLYPNKSNVYNLANCYRALHRYGEAISMFERVLSEFDKKLKREMREDARNQIDEINSIVGRLSLEITPAGATVVLDGETIGQSPLSKPLILAPGAHRLRISLTGHDTVEQTLEMTSATEIKMPIVLVESKAALTVRADVDGAEVVVNGDLAGTTPLASSLMLAKGEYLIQLRKDGYEPAEKSVTLEPGAEVETNFDLVRLSPPPVVQPPTSTPAAATQKETKRFGPLFWTGLAGTVVLGGVSGAMWGLSVSKRNDYNSTVGEMGTLADDWENNRYDGTYAEFTTDWAALESDANGYADGMETFKWAAIGTSIGAGAFAVLAVVGAVVRFPDERETAFRLEAAPGGLRVRF